MTDKFSGAELDTLIALVERGPLDPGDLPSKAGRTALLDRGYAVMVLVNGQDGFTAATYKGRDAYTAHFGTSLGGQADTVAEAKANRIAQRAISNSIRND